MTIVMEWKIILMLLIRVHIEDVGNNPASLRQVNRVNCPLHLHAFVSILLLRSYNLHIASIHMAEEFFRMILFTFGFLAVEMSLLINYYRVMSDSLRCIVVVFEKIPSSVLLLDAYETNRTVVGDYFISLIEDVVIEFVEMTVR